MDGRHIRLLSSRRVRTYCISLSLRVRTRLPRHEIVAAVCWVRKAITILKSAPEFASVSLGFYVDLERTLHRNQVAYFFAASTVLFVSMGLQLQCALRKTTKRPAMRGGDVKNSCPLFAWFKSSFGRPDRTLLLFDIRRRRYLPIVARYICVVGAAGVCCCCSARSVCPAA